MKDDFLNNVYNKAKQNGSIITRYPVVIFPKEKPYKIIDGYVQIPIEDFRGSKLYNVTKAAEFLGISRQRVSKAAKDGALRKRDICGTPYFTEQDLLDYRKADKSAWHRTKEKQCKLNSIS